MPIQKYLYPYFSEVTLLEPDHFDTNVSGLSFGETKLFKAVHFYMGVVLSIVKWSICLPWALLIHPVKSIYGHFALMPHLYSKRYNLFFFPRIASLRHVSVTRRVSSVSNSYFYCEAESEGCRVKKEGYRNKSKG